MQFNDFFLYDMILETFKLDMYTRHNNDKKITRMVSVFTIIMLFLFMYKNITQCNVAIKKRREQCSAMQR